MNRISAFFSLIRCRGCCDTVEDNHGGDVTVSDIDWDEVPLDVTWKSLTPFTPRVEWARVVKVYDADTITVAARVPTREGSAVHRFPVRLIGIDTPEIKGGTRQETLVAKHARDKLVFLHKNMVRLESGDKNDKYGRLLARVFYDDLCVNDWLVAQKLAVPYDGGTKNSPKSWVEYSGVTLDEVSGLIIDK